MRLIHTADWHIGQVFYGYDRSDEHVAALRALCRIVEDAQPDVLLVSGDVFHNPQPSASSQQLFTTAITELRDAAPQMAIIITAGNHDSATRHEVFSRVWRRLGVYVIGSAASDDAQNIEKLIISLPECFVLAVPYIYGRAIDDGLFPRLLAEVERRNTDNLPVIAMAHLMMPFGEIAPLGDFKGADEPKPLELLGEGYDYLALGHVHHPVAIPGAADAVRYSGSLIPVSFAEDFAHSVVQVDIAAHGTAPEIKLLPVEEPIPVVSLPRGGFKPWAEALAEVKAYSSSKPVYVRVCVSRDEPVPADANETLQKICSDKGLRFCLLHYPPLTAASGAGETQGLTFDEFRELSPAEVASLYLRDNGFELGDGAKALFDGILSELGKEDEP